jgi:hypothetical protein
MRKINRIIRLVATSLLVVFLSGVTSDTIMDGSILASSPILIAAGDISTCDNDNDEATARLLDQLPGTIIALGDNVYLDGSEAEFANCYHPTWGRHKERTQPVPGNHEYFTPGATGYFNYFNNIPSYYGYNLGDWRIYALNSEIDVSATSAQLKWLKDDLAANARPCILAYWHKPLWSSSYEDGSDSDYQLLWQILHDAGTEVVVNGHIHNYERFAEMNASGEAKSPGMRQIIAGTGGVNHYGFINPLSTSQVRNSSTYGVLKLSLSSTSYSWQFIPVAGKTFTDSGSQACH